MKTFLHKKSLPFLFLCIFLMFIFYITLYTRTFTLTQSCQLDLFWSYREWMKGRPGIAREILLNIALFVPLGYFLSHVLDSCKVKRYGLVAGLLALAVSSAVEVIQYVDGLGLGELDDIFNNVLGAFLGIGVYKLLSRFCNEDKLPCWKLILSVLFLLAGAVGCHMVKVAPPLSSYALLQQFDFAVTRVDAAEHTLSLQGYCRAYYRDTPPYQIILRGEETGKEYSARTEVDGDSFRASAAVPSGEPCEVLVKFKYYAPVRTLFYLKGNRAANVAGPVTEPDITDTDLGEIVNRGILKAWEPKFDVYVYQFSGRLYWLVGSPLDKRTEIVLHLHTNEPAKLPENRRKYKFDNLGFRAGGKNELTGTMRCGKYRVFEREIPSGYHITAVRVGFYADKKMQWQRHFRVGE